MPWITSVIVVCIGHACIFHIFTSIHKTHNPNKPFGNIVYVFDLFFFFYFCYWCSHQWLLANMIFIEMNERPSKMKANTNMKWLFKYWKLCVWVSVCVCFFSFVNRIEQVILFKPEMHSSYRSIRFRFDKRKKNVWKNLLIVKYDE